MNDLLNKFGGIVDNMEIPDIAELCTLLLIKRSVDGLNGRPWDAVTHLDAEHKIQAIMKEFI